MPRYQADHRPARAILAAPYPLPFIITRPSPEPPVPHPSQFSQESDNPNPNPTPEAEYSGAIPIWNTPTGFPPYNTQWRDLPPAIPPIPYPTPVEGDESRMKANKRKWKVRLIKPRQAGQENIGEDDVDEDDDRELEVMSGIEEEGFTVSRELMTTREIGSWSMGQAGDQIGSGTQPAFRVDNILTSTIQASIPQSIIDWSSPAQNAASAVTPTPVLFPTPKPDIPQSRTNTNTFTPTIQVSNPQSIINWQAALPSASCPAPASKPEVPLRSPFQEVRKPELRRDIPPRREIFESEPEADSEESLRPSTLSPKNRRRRTKAKTSIPQKPLFLGQTNLMPFTYIPQRGSTVKHDFSEFESDATTTNRTFTRTRIPRSKFLRNKSQLPDHTSANNHAYMKNNSKRYTESRYQDHREDTHHRYLTYEPRLQAHNPSRYPRYYDNASTTHTHTYMPTPESVGRRSNHRSHSSSVASDRTARPGAISPSSRTTPVPDAIPEEVSSPITIKDEDNDPTTPRPWSPQPISIDPLSSMPSQASWPHPLPSRESNPPHFPLSLPLPINTYQQGPNIPQGITSPTQTVEIPEPSPLQWTSPNHSLRLPSVPPTRINTERQTDIPIAKLCHNFLLARKVQAARRRKLVQEHNKRMDLAAAAAAAATRARENQIPTPMVIDTPSEPVFQISQPQGQAQAQAQAGPSVPWSSTIPAPTVGNVGGFRPISSIATIDFSKPPRKRRRSISPESVDEDWYPRYGARLRGPGPSVSQGMGFGNGNGNGNGTGNQEIALGVQEQRARQWVDQVRRDSDRTF